LGLWSVTASFGNTLSAVGPDRLGMMLDGGGWVAGIEPSSYAESTVNCQLLCAPRALDPGGFNCHFVASLDADLQRMIAAWEGLPAAIRRAIVGLADSQGE
jgi:hypothetical protein